MEATDRALDISEDHAATGQRRSGVRERREAGPENTQIDREKDYTALKLAANTNASTFLAEYSTMTASGTPLIMNRV